MDSTTFYLLAWYDWCLWMDRIRELQRQRMHDNEVMMDLGRRLLSQYWNWNRGKTGHPTEPKDFWRLSWDRDEEISNTQVKPEDDERTKETISRLERVAQERIKKKRGG